MTERQFVSKGWGFEDVIVNKPAYCGKRLYVAKNRKCSWHYHMEKDETFFVVSGLLLLRWLAEDEVQVRDEWDWDNEMILALAHSALLCPGDSFYVPPGMRHQFEAYEDTVIMEFSTEHKDEDTVRVIRGD